MLREHTHSQPEPSCLLTTVPGPTPQLQVPVNKKGQTEDHLVPFELLSLEAILESVFLDLDRAVFFTRA